MVARPDKAHRTDGLALNALLDTDDPVLVYELPVL